MQHAQNSTGSDLSVTWRSRSTVLPKQQISNQLIRAGDLMQRIFDILRHEVAVVLNHDRSTADALA